MHGLQQEYHRTRFQFPWGKMSLPLLVIRYFFSQQWFVWRWRTFLRSCWTCRVHKGNTYRLIWSPSAVRLLKKCTTRSILFWTAFNKHRCLRRTVLTGSVTLQSRVLIQKVTILSKRRNSPHYETPSFTAVFKAARHMSPLLNHTNQSTPSHFISTQFSLILSSHLRLGLLSSRFTSRFPTETLTHFSSSLMH